MRNFTKYWRFLRETLIGDREGARIVPPARNNAWLVFISATAMGLLASLALVIALIAGAQAARWSDSLVGSAILTLPLEASSFQEQRALQILSETPGASEPVLVDEQDYAEALGPWVEDGADLNALILPKLITFNINRDFDAAGFRLRLEGEIPTAQLDDQSRWREPLRSAALRLRLLSYGAILLCLMVMTISIRLAAEAVLAVNKPVLSLLREFGAGDDAIARIFIRRLTLQNFQGAALGSVLALLIVWLWPVGTEDNPLVQTAKPSNMGILLLLFLPIFAALIGFWAARRACIRRLLELP